MPDADAIVIGAGIVGLAAALAVTDRRPGTRVVVLEKESGVARHQSGRNSGVVHSGVYYTPGSLKARLCIAGMARLEAFCAEHGVPFRTTGKLIVAAADGELDRLARIEQRGAANGVPCERLDPKEARALEPNVRCAGALHVRSSGVVDYAAVCRTLARLLERRRGGVAFGARLLRAEVGPDEITLHTAAGPFTTERVVNCAGLYADRVARLLGQKPPARIVPFRGEYFRVTGGSAGIVSRPVYPTPDPRFPFLGAHYTRTIGGELEAGPNAVLALSREGYTKRAFRPQDAFDALTYTGLWRLSLRNLGTGLGEMHRASSRSAFAKQLRKMTPDLDPADLEPAPAGVRAQALTPRGELVEDFAIMTDGRVTSVVNAPSPAATSALAIGEMVAKEAVGG